jgi:predicted AAA+ superfamily ATPase
LGLHDERALMQGPAAGALTESAVVGEWMKAFRVDGLPPPLYFWRSSDGLEVDLVIEHGGRLFGVEVKSTSTPRPPHAEALSRWLRLAGSGAAGVLACDVREPQALRPGVRAVPWHLAW